MTDMGRFVRGLPKSELHIHVEGTLEARMMFELAGRNGMTMPYASIEEVEAIRDNSRFIGSLTLNHTPFDWLTHRAVVGLDQAHEENRTLFPRHPTGAQHDFGGLSLGDVVVERPYTRYITFDYAATGTVNLSDLTLRSSVGAQYYSKQFETVISTGKTFPAPAITSLAGAASTTSTEDFVQNKTLGAYVQQEIGYRDRIFITGAIRGDDNSAFGADFDAAVYPKLSGTTHNVFGIQVGVSINFLVKKNGEMGSQPGIYYARVDEFWRKEEKYRYLDAKDQYGNIEWKTIKPDKRNSWLTEGHHVDYETFPPMGRKEAKKANIGEGEAIFRLYSLGVATKRDAWVYSFDMKLLQERVRTFVEIYNSTVDGRRRLDPTAPVENFIDENDPRIKWTRQVKASLKKLDSNTYEDTHFRISLYRPFSKRHLYFDNFWNEERYQQFRIFPIPETEQENRAIIVPSAGGRADYWCFCTDIIPNLTLTSLDGSQCFPFYTYDEDGSNRRENVTDWGLAQFRAHYGDDTITKWDIFHYVYGLLHHPGYRERYQANLKRELPRIPFAPDFRAFAAAGSRLAQIHVGYEEQPEYPLASVETPNMQLDWRVEKMRLSRDKTQLRYNSFLTLHGIPSEVFSYRLGNRSALEWIIDQYRVKTDKRSGIVNDPNRADDPQYILRLIGKVISVRLEKVEIVAGLPELGIGEKEISE